MSAVLCIGGWHSDAETPRDELQEHWGHQFAPRFAPGKEVYGLLWESAELAAFGNALSDMAKRQVTGYAVGKGLAYTALGSIIAAVAFPLFVVEVAGLIDNAYSARWRADKAALILADAIKNRVQGRRPLTIVACSLGAGSCSRRCENWPGKEVKLPLIASAVAPAAHRVMGKKRKRTNVPRD